MHGYPIVLAVFSDRESLARPERFELPAPRFVVWCSIQLSYGRIWEARTYWGGLPKARTTTSFCGKGATPSNFRPSPGAYGKISTPSGIVLPCRLPPRWLRLVAEV